ncbi:probable GH family 25 lysozyme 3 [Mytilus trossulus]|uniref:probable GH family 25 lysozyme 3 n=1 Tax=Mytilus trossulus TaxID=6551 RepID=UPI0030048238
MYLSVVAILIDVLARQCESQQLGLGNIMAGSPSGGMAELNNMIPSNVVNMISNSLPQEYRHMVPGFNQPTSGSNPASNSNNNPVPNLKIPNWFQQGPTNSNTGNGSPGNMQGHGSPGQSGHSTGNIPSGQSKWNGPTGQSSGNSPSGHTTGNSPSSQTHGNSPSGQTTGNNPQGQNNGPPAFWEPAPGTGQGGINTGAQYINTMGQMAKTFAQDLLQAMHLPNSVI